MIAKLGREKMNDGMILHHNFSNPFSSPVSGVLILKHTSVEYWASLVAQRVKCPPAMLETRFLYLGQEDPLKKEMATHSSILAWRSPLT